MEANASYEVMAQTRRDRDQKRTSKAFERRAQRALHIQELKTQVVASEVGLANEERKQQSHVDRAAAAVTLDIKAIALFSKKLQEVQEHPLSAKSSRGEGFASPSRPSVLDPWRRRASFGDVAPTRGRAHGAR